jgi:hypothetical protein
MQPLSILTEPRRSKDIARIISRPPSDTTGQLLHLLRRGLGVRVSKGVYDIMRPDRHQAFTLDPTKQLRPNAGASRPTEMPTPVGGTGAMQGA